MKTLIAITLLLCSCAATTKRPTAPMIGYVPQGLIKVNEHLHHIIAIDDTVWTCGCDKYKITARVGDGNYNSNGPIDLFELDKFPLPKAYFHYIYFNIQDIRYWMWSRNAFITTLKVECFRQRIDVIN